MSETQNKMITTCFTITYVSCSYSGHDEDYPVAGPGCTQTFLHSETHCTTSGTNGGGGGFSGGDIGDSGNGGTPNYQGGIGGSGNGTVTSPLPECRQNNCLSLEGLILIDFLSSLSKEQQDWYNNDISAEMQNDIDNFLLNNLENNEVSDEAQAFFEAAINFLINNPDIDFYDIPFLIGPDNPIENIDEYLECFEITQGAILTIYVDQPIANQDDAFTTGDGKAGHAFISLEQGDITRVLGLYPEGNASPFSPNDPFKFGNDQGEEFDVSISIPINFASLDNIINDVTNYNSSYDLNSNNCTDFVLDSAGLSGLNLPDPQSDWPNGGGSNPGAFGESLRDLNLPVGSNRNNNGGNAPMNSGTCN